MGQATSLIKSPSELPKLGRIDMHGHFTPPILIETMGAAELGGFAKWTPEEPDAYTFRIGTPAYDSSSGNASCPQLPQTDS